MDRMIQLEIAVRELLEAVLYQFECLPDTKTPEETKARVQIATKLAQVGMILDQKIPSPERIGERLRLSNGTLSFRFDFKDAVESGRIKDKKIAAIKAVKKLAFMGLKDAKEFVETGMAGDYELKVGFQVPIEDRAKWIEDAMREIKDLEDMGVKVGVSS